VPLLSAFSALELQFNGTSGGTPSSITESYSVVYASATTFKVNLNFQGDGQNMNSTAWILRSNGSAIAIDEAGYNLTSSITGSLVVGLFAGFSAEIQAASQLSTYTSNQYFKSTGTSSVTLGTNTFTVTNYVANTLPQTITPCNGSPTTLTNFALSVGTPSGSSTKLVTYLAIAGSDTINGVATPYNTVIKVVSLTVA
jgi:hypothetical protein